MGVIDAIGMAVMTAITAGAIAGGQQAAPAVEAPKVEQAKPAKDDTSTPELTEVQRLKGAVVRLQMENEALRAQLATANLRALQAPAQSLEAEYLATMKAPPGSVWDWSTMTATRPAGAPAAKP
jgi:hypothetical protein